MKRNDRIKTMEEKFDKSLEVIRKLDEALDDFKNNDLLIKELIKYYESDLWLKDYNADLEGKLPKDLKRGILSEDGIYNLLIDYDRLKKLL